MRHRLRDGSALLWLLVVTDACALPDAPVDRAPHPALRKLWTEYTALPEHRALAIAGEPRSGKWVAGATGGHATRDAAERAALRQCAERRARRNMVAPCRLYAVGDERV